MWTSLPLGLAIVFLSGTAFAQTEISYLAADGGSALPSALAAAPSSNIAMVESMLQGGSVGVYYGYRFGNGFKAEIEGVTPRESTARAQELPLSGSLSRESVMLNGLYEFSEGGWRTKPYVGGGFGMVDISQRFAGARGNDWVAAYQLRGGVSMGFSQRLLGSIEYRWTKGSKPNFTLAGIPTQLDVDSRGFNLGINYKY